MTGEKKKRPNPGKGEIIEAAMLVEMFKETVQTNATLTAQMGVVCECLKENTETTRELLNHLSGIPACLGKIKATVNMVKWGLLPVILSLIGLVVFFAVRR